MLSPKTILKGRQGFEENICFSDIYCGDIFIVYYFMYFCEIAVLYCTNILYQDSEINYFIEKLSIPNPFLYNH